jgi:IS5 family transposase
MKRSTLADANGIPLGTVTAPANTHDSLLLAPTLDLLDEVGPLPERIKVHLDRGYDSAKTRQELAERGLEGQIAQRGLPAPVQAGMRWPVERTHAWGNAFNRLQRCYERCRKVIAAFFSLAHAIITLRRLIRLAWTAYRWDARPQRRP